MPEVEPVPVTTFLRTGHVVVQSAICATVRRCGPVEVDGSPDMFELCLVRRGCFDFRDGRGRTRVDPGTAILGAPGQTGEVSHPAAGGDTTTMVFLHPEVVASLEINGPLDLAARLTPTMQWRHRRLLRAAAEADDFATEELAVGLFGGALAAIPPARARSGADQAGSGRDRPATERARRAVVEEARQALVAEPGLPSLVDLARRIGVSPHHLSRLFSAQTGRSLSAFRTEMRINAVLEEFLDDGRDTLAVIAARHGFADHAHLTRTLGQHLHATPTEIRAWLRARSGGGR